MNAAQRKAQRDAERTEKIRAGIRAMLKLAPWPAAGK